VPALGERARVRARGVLAARDSGFDLGDQLGPRALTLGEEFGRAALLEVGELLRRVVLLDPIHVLLHFDHLYDSGERLPSIVPRRHDALRLEDRAHGSVHLPAFLLERLALTAQPGCKVERAVVEQLADAFEREADELERHDLLKALEVSRAVEPVA